MHNNATDNSVQKISAEKLLNQEKYNKTWRFKENQPHPSFNNNPTNNITLPKTSDSQQPNCLSKKISNPFKSFNRSCDVHDLNINISQVEQISDIHSSIRKHAFLKEKVALNNNNSTIGASKSINTTTDRFGTSDNRLNKEKYNNNWGFKERQPKIESKDSQSLANPINRQTNLHDDQHELLAIQTTNTLKESIQHSNQDPVDPSFSVVQQSIRNGVDSKESTTLLKHDETRKTNERSAKPIQTVLMLDKSKGSEKVFHNVIESSSKDRPPLDEKEGQVRLQMEQMSLHPPSAPHRHHSSCIPLYCSGGKLCGEKLDYRYPSMPLRCQKGHLVGRMKQRQTPHDPIPLTGKCVYCGQELEDQLLWKSLREWKCGRCSKGLHGGVFNQYGIVLH